MKYDSLVFDLDGTLWNACSASAKGWTEGLKQLGYNKLLTANDISSVCGLTYENCVKTLCPEISESDLPHVLETLNVTEKQSVEKFSGDLYPDVLFGLQKLQEMYDLYLVSNCQEWYLDCFLTRYNSSSIFKDWECHGRTNKGKASNLMDIKTRNTLKNPLYIGDTEGDMRASYEAGYAFAYVAYGFGRVECPLSFKSFSDLVEFLIK